MNIQLLFPQFIYDNITNMNCHDLQKYCYDTRKRSEGRKNSNIGGWQSLDSTDENIFFTSVTEDLKFLTDSLQISHLNFFLINFWININQKNNFNLQHSHPSSFLSGVLYVKVPKNSGKIVFLDPLRQVRVCYEEYWHITDSVSRNKLFYKKYEIIPEDGMLILFPSWLEHYVEPNNSDEDRISIAFNIGVKV
jgi:uncharacterized protein (TIGR02466 family)